MGSLRQSSVLALCDAPTRSTDDEVRRAGHVLGLAHPLQMELRIRFCGFAGVDLTDRIRALIGAADGPLARSAQPRCPHDRPVLELLARFVEPLRGPGPEAAARVAGPTCRCLRSY